MTEHTNRDTNTPSTGDTQGVLAAAKDLLAGMSQYGHVEAAKQPVLVAAVLLALNNPGFTPHKPQQGNHDTEGNTTSLGENVYQAAQQCLTSAGLPETSISTIMGQFVFLKNDTRINQVHPALGEPVISWVCRTAREHLYEHMTGEHAGPVVDVLGYLYRESAATSGGDGQALGIVLTPPHLTTLMAELISISPEDTVLDPTCGTGSFLLAAEQTANHRTPGEKKTGPVVCGVEIQEKLFTLATTTMVLRHGTSRIVLGSFLDDSTLLGFTPEAGSAGVGVSPRLFSKMLLNPPYGLAKNKTTRHLSELAFIERSLSLLEPGGRLAAIVPQSTVVGKTKDDAERKRRILQQHTLETVITVNGNAFMESGYSPRTVIAVFSAGRPHPEGKQVGFVNFETDGWVVSRHTGLVDDGTVTDRRARLLNVLNGEEEAGTDFLVRSVVTPVDEWHHAYFYFNDTPPSEADFLSTVADYVSWQVGMFAHGNGHLITPADKESGEQEGTE